MGKYGGYQSVADDYRDMALAPYKARLAALEAKIGNDNGRVGRSAGGGNASYRDRIERAERAFNDPPTTRPAVAVTPRRGRRVLSERRSQTKTGRPFIERMVIVDGCELREVEYTDGGQGAISHREAR